MSTPNKNFNLPSPYVALLTMLLTSAACTNIDTKIENIDMAQCNVAHPGRGIDCFLQHNECSGPLQTNTLLSIKKEKKSKFKNKTADKGYDAGKKLLGLVTSSPLSDAFNSQVGLPIKEFCKMPVPNKLEPKVVIISTDGYRPTEFFNGTDSIKNLLIAETQKMAAPQEAIQIMPFIKGAFTQIIPSGTTIRGERASYAPEESAPNTMTGKGIASVLNGKIEPGCKINNEWGLSLPGYADFLSGVRQTNVISNMEPTSIGGGIHLAYPTLMDRLTDTPLILGTQEVAVFATWSTIKYAATRYDSPKFTISAGKESGDQDPPWLAEPAAKLPIEGPEAEQILKLLSSGNSRSDDDTFNKARNYINNPNNNPRLLFISFGGTDEWAHRGNYLEYINSAKKFDEYVKQIVEAVEAKEGYTANTTYILTTDHGRGTGQGSWTNHLSKEIVGLKPYAGTEWIWQVVVSPHLANNSKLQEAWHNTSCNHTSVAKLALAVLGGGR